MEGCQRIKKSNPMSQKMKYHNKKIHDMEDKERSTKYNIPGFEVISNSNYQILINIFELDHIKLGI